jgi:hypothetical protein
MSSCNHCKSKEWCCVGCGHRIARAIYEAEFENLVAVYCNCCDHNFACNECYKQNSDFEYWRKKFGVNHAIYDKISGESMLSRALKLIMSGREFPGGNIGGLTIITSKDLNK